ncbi:MAG: C-GCAxxG-C-C family protein [Bacteroides sp.]|nr:C-GCAxxG-C-C family protein [Bacteroides sp.]
MINLPENFNVEERANMARQNFLDGYNCCQAVLLAFTDVLDIDRKTAATIASGFGGGMGRLREVCGTVSALTIAAGLISPADDPSIKSARTANYAIVQELAGKFRERNGSIVCRELLGLSPRTQESPVPSDRTNEYYRKRPCPELAACSARILAKKLMEMAGRDSACSN